jgi:hypothetical protein
MQASSALNVLGGAVNHTVVISPCSSCKNHRLSYTDEGYWPCPRKVWEERHKNRTDVNAVPDYLVETDSEDNTFRNPVYAEKLKMVLVWTANLAQNSGLYLPGQTALATPDILDPKFNSAYIKCNELPSLLMETEAAYYQAGAYKEGELAINFGVQPFQYHSSLQPTMVSGFVKRVDLMFQQGFQTLDDDVIVSGM